MLDLSHEIQVVVHRTGRILKFKKTKEVSDWLESESSAWKFLSDSSFEGREANYAQFQMGVFVSVQEALRQVLDYDGADIDVSKHYTNNLSAAFDLIRAGLVVTTDNSLTPMILDIAKSNPDIRP